MSIIKYFYILLISMYSCEIFSQVNTTDNLRKIAESYIEYKTSKGKFDTNKDIIIMGANSIDDNTYWFEIAFDSVYNLTEEKYDKVYSLNGFKILIIDDTLNKINLLKKSFQEVKFENINKGKYNRNYEVSSWYILLNNKNEVLSIKSKYPENEVIDVLKKNKIQFSLQ